MGNSIYIHDHLVIYNNSVISPVIGAGSGEKIIYANASGRAFPIWNTINEKTLTSLHIYGKSTQDGNATPLNPIKINSVGEQGLLLTISDTLELDSNYYTINVSKALYNAGLNQIALRSVDKIADEIVYDGNTWKLIQRIGVSKGFTVSSITLQNTNDNLREVLIRGAVKGNAPTASVSTFYSNKFYYTGDSTSNKWNNVYGVYTNSLRYAFTVVYDVNDYATEDDLKVMVEDESTIYYYVLNEPIEYELDLQKINTFDDVTYVTTNSAIVKPYMEANSLVSELLEPVKSNLVYWFEFSPLNITDSNTVYSKVDKTDYITLYNLGNTSDSGPVENYIQFDGIDDYGSISSEKSLLSYQMLVSDIYAASSNLWVLSSNNYNIGYYTYNNNSIHFNKIDSDNIVYDNNIQRPLTFLTSLVNDGTNHLFTVNDDTFNLSIIGKYRNSNNTNNKFKSYALLGYNKQLNEDEISNNVKYCQQQFGIDGNGKDLLACGSGDEKFVIWNTIADGIDKFYIYGETIQNGEPSIETPATLSNVGDNDSIALTITDDTSNDAKQIINFNGIVLRSIYTWNTNSRDYLLYADNKWHLVKSVDIITYDDLTDNITYFGQGNNGKQYNIATKENTVGYTIISNKLLTQTNPDWTVTQKVNTGITITNQKYIRICVPNEYDTIDKVKEYLGEDIIILYGILDPVITELSFDRPITFEGQTWFSTYLTEPRPFIKGIAKVNMPVEYIQDGLLCYHSANGFTKLENNTYVLSDLTGNGLDLRLYNIGHNKSSGKWNNYIQFDGIDDYANRIWTNKNVRTLQTTYKDIIPDNNVGYNISQLVGNDRAPFFSISDGKIIMYNDIGYLNAVNLGKETHTKYLSKVNGIFTVTISQQNNISNDYELNYSIGTANIYASPQNYVVQEKFYDAVLYNRILTSDEVLYNYKVSQQLNGVNGYIPTYGYASGKGVVIYNTMNNSKIKYLSIHGASVQNDTPTLDTPVDIQSVGSDTEDIALSIMVDKAEGGEYQFLNITKALKKVGHDGILRSVDNAYDEVIYDGNSWKLIKRVGKAIINEFDTLYSKVTGTVGAYKTNDSEVNVYKTYALSNRAKYVDKVPDELNDDEFCYQLNSPFYFKLNVKANEAQEWVKNNNITLFYKLNEPVEYVLDLPAVSMYNDVTYIGTNTLTVKPRIEVEAQVYRQLDYIKDGLVGYYTGRGRGNRDLNKNILPDLSGNGNDLENKNFAYTPESGYGDGYIQYDGVDDFSSVAKAMTNVDFTILFTISDVELLTGNSWSGLIYGSSYYLGINKGICFSSENRYIMNGNVSNTNFNISNKGKEIFVVGCFNGGKENKVIGITLGSINNSPIYACKQKIYDVLIYNRELTEEEIKHNYKASCQYNGIEINGYDFVNNLHGINNNLSLYNI